MFSLLFYKFIHIAGLFLLLMSLGAIASHRLQGGTKATFKNRGFFMALHGVGVAMAFVAGFALMGKMGFSFANNLWLFIKIIAWVIVAAYPVVFYRQRADSKLPYLGLIVVLLITVYAVEYKPF